MSKLNLFFDLAIIMSGNDFSLLSASRPQIYLSIYLSFTCRAERLIRHLLLIYPIVIVPQLSDPDHRQAALCCTLDVLLWSVLLIICCLLMHSMCWTTTPQRHYFMMRMMRFVCFVYFNEQSIGRVFEHFCFT